MKILVFAGLIAGLSIKGFSQGPPELGVFAGPQITSAHYTVEGEKQETTYKFGYQAGVLLKVPFDNHLFFSPNVYYSLKGYDVTLKNGSYPPSTLAKNNNTTIHTIEVGGFLQYDFKKEPGGFFVKAGPAFDFVFSGQETFTLADETIVDQPMKFSFGDYGRITASLNVQFGYETRSRYMFFAHYAHGLGSMNNADGGPQIKHRIIGISVGKYLKKLKG
ncbi:MAG: PorT family protein [Chitinophagaceae bacterium]|jgi:hypothetical protein|nr:PorT family protein [Chitinophagaceae bacterium]